MLLASNDDLDVIFYIAVIVLIFLAIFLVRVLINKAVNSENCILIAVIMSIACLLSAAPFVVSFIMKAISVQESYDFMNVMKLIGVMFACELCVAFIFTSSVGPVYEDYTYLRECSDGKYRYANATEKKNGFFSSLLLSLVVALVVTAATILIIDYAGTAWYTYILVCIPSAIVFVPTLVFTVMSIKNAAA